MAVNDRIWTSLSQHGGGTINERVYNYLGSLGFTGTISDRLAKYTHNNKHGWQALIEGFGLSGSAGVLRQGLFGDGQEGVMYVPQPTYLGQQVLYQDAAGTTSVTEDGDPVRLMLDISGNGHNATIPSDAARLTYRTDGTLHWLQSDGVDDRVVLPPIPYQASDELAVFIAMQRINDSPQYSSFRSRFNTSGRYCGLNNPSVTGTTSDIGGDIRVNGQAVADDRVSLFNALRPSPAVGSSLGNDPSTYGSTQGEILSYGPVAPPSATLYGYIEVVGLSVPREDAENYLASLSGITL